MSIAPVTCGIESCERHFVLPRRLADRGTHHQFENCVLAGDGGSRGRNVAIGHSVRVARYFVDQRCQRLVESGVLECRAALTASRAPIAVQNPRCQYLS
jgi:hypothetical protein